MPCAFVRNNSFLCWSILSFSRRTLVTLFALRSTTMQCVFHYLRGLFTRAKVWAMGGLEHWRSLVIRVVGNFCCSMRCPCLCLVCVALFPLPLEPQLLTSRYGWGASVCVSCLVVEKKQKKQCHTFQPDDVKHCGIHRWSFPESSSRAVYLYLYLLTFSSLTGSIGPNFKWQPWYWFSNRRNVFLSHVSLIFCAPNQLILSIISLF